jgi:hypothetical protein
MEGGVFSIRDSVPLQGIIKQLKLILKGILRFTYYYYRSTSQRTHKQMFSELR